jgi:hypothetical protein
MDRCNTKKRRKPKLAIELRVEIFTNLHQQKTQRITQLALGSSLTASQSGLLLCAATPPPPKKKRKKQGENPVWKRRWKGGNFYK